MEQERQNGREILGRLAHEYEEKLGELEALMKDSPREQILLQLKVQGGKTMNRFRTAQMLLFEALTSPAEPDRDKILQAVTALSRSFDELNILFNALLENSGDKLCDV